MLAILFGLVSSKLHLSISEESQFLQWMRTNNKFYIGDEYHFRLGIFLTSLRYVREFNRRNGLTFRVGLNKFSCSTPAELKSILGGYNSYNLYKQVNSFKSKTDSPDSFDWRDKGVVNPVKNQDKCGACWAFSAISTSESAYAISTGNLIQFSEQNLIDCISGAGCGGGWADSGCNYIITEQKGQFNSEADYPYTAADGTCKYDSSKAVGKIVSVTSVAYGDENDLKDKIAQYGVASVSISAGNAPFTSYTGGILDDNECSIYLIDHAVACVGYGTENSVDYWIVRNSWGKDWGEEGYVRMIRNKNNKCGIASQAFIAISEK